MDATTLQPGRAAPLSAPLTSERQEAADEQLIQAARTGDRAALETLMGRYRGRVYVFTLALLQRSEDAEDATQETFVRAVRGLPGYRERGSFRQWLLTIAANVCRNHRREAGRRPALVPEEAVGETAAADPGYERSALRTAVREAIARLPQAYRGPVVLFYLEELPVAEIARILGRSQAAIKVQLWRARGRLAGELAEWLE